MLADIGSRQCRREAGSPEPSSRGTAELVEFSDGPDAAPAPADWLAQYDTGGFYDEMFARPAAGAGGAPCARPHYEWLHASLAAFGPDEFRRRCALADLSLMHQGITFTVYGDHRGVERP